MAKKKVEKQEAQVVGIVEEGIPETNVQRVQVVEVRQDTALDTAKENDAKPKSKEKRVKKIRVPAMVKLRANTNYMFLAPHLSKVTGQNFFLDLHTRIRTIPAGVNKNDLGEILRGIQVGILEPIYDTDLAKVPQLPAKDR